LASAACFAFWRVAAVTEAANAGAANSDEPRKNNTVTVVERVGNIFSKLLCDAICESEIGKRKLADVAI
jgi:hypothetical protein